MFERKSSTSARDSIKRLLGAENRDVRSDHNRVTGCLTPMQRAELLTQAAGLDLGENYGASFFQAKAQLLLCNYLTHYADPRPEDSEELFRALGLYLASQDVGLP
jgi:hypothetical protein